MNRNTLHLLLFIAASLTLVACQETLEERCAREARTYTEKKCPTLITEGVMLDSLTFQQSTHTLSYCYTASDLFDDAQMYIDKDVRGLLLKAVKNEPEMNVSSTRAFDGMGTSWKVWAKHLSFALKLGALACLIVILCRPQTKDSWSTSDVEGTDIVIALDVSTSMLA